MRWKSAFLGIAISVLTTYVIFKLTETNVTWETLRQLNPLYLILAFLFQVFFWIFWAIRLRRISLYMGYRISYLFSLRTTLSSMFLAAITPSSAGGEPLRIKMISDNGIPLGSSTLIVLTERILDSIFFSMALLIFLALTEFSMAWGFEIAIIFILLLFIFVYILYLILKKEENIKRFSKVLAKIIRKKNIEVKIEGELRNFRAGTLQLVSNPIKLLHLFSLTAFMWSIGFMIPSLILISMKSDPEFLLSYTSQLIIVIVSLLPITPGSSGIVETTMAYLYSNFVPSSLLGSLIAIWRFITYHTNIIFGLMALNFSTLKSLVKSRSQV